MAACAPSAPQSPHVMSYAHLVPPGQTFDMARGEAVPDAALVERLRGVRLLFIGENHTDSASHAFQADLIDRLAATGRPLVVALEYLPPEADAALEDWRQGRLAEDVFLERSGWYEHWRYPWAYYRDLFLRLQAHRIPLRGVNASSAERALVRDGKAAELPADLRALLGDPDERIPPHVAYLADALDGTGHARDMTPDSPAFARYYRVQRLWDRLMGVRTAQLAEAQPADGLAILLVGSGHLAFGLGANLQAARATPLPRLTVWDTPAHPGSLDAAGRYPVALGTADWVRVHPAPTAPTRYPSLLALKLAAAPTGVKVEAVQARHGSPLAVFRAGDQVRALNDGPVASPAALRLAFERLPWGPPARFAVERDGQAQELTVPLPQPTP